MEEKQFNKLQREGNSIFVDNKLGDKVKFKPVGLIDQEDFFVKNMTTAFEKAWGAIIVKENERELSCSLEAILYAYNELLTQTEEVNSNRSGKEELSNFINTLMNNLGKNALADMFSRISQKPSISVFEDNGNYKFYIEVNGKKVDVNTSRYWYNLLLLDGSSIDELIVPEATVLVRLKPAAEEFLRTSLITCCDVLKYLVDSGVSDEGDILGKLDEIVKDKKRKEDECDKALYGLIQERKAFEKGSEKYKVLSSKFFNKRNERETIRLAIRALSALKGEIEAVYVPGAPFFVSLFKCDVLNDILNSPLEWSFDVPGFVTREDVQFITSGDDFKIGKDQTLNKAKLGNTSFYVRAADLRPFEDILEVL